MASLALVCYPVHITIDADDLQEDRHMSLLWVRARSSDTRWWAPTPNLVPSQGPSNPLGRLHSSLWLLSLWTTLCLTLFLEPFCHGRPYLGKISPLEVDKAPDAPQQGGDPLDRPQLTWEHFGIPPEEQVRSWAPVFQAQKRVKWTDGVCMDINVI